MWSQGKITETEVLATEHTCLMSSQYKSQLTYQIISLEH